MKGTCRKEQCKLWDLFDGDCPNYVEGWWKPEQGEPELVEDCAPRRALIMLQQIWNRLLSLQKAQEQQRNKSTQVMGNLCEFVEFLIRRDYAESTSKLPSFGLTTRPSEGAGNLSNTEKSYLLTEGDV